MVLQRLPDRGAGHRERTSSISVMPVGWANTSSTRPGDGTCIVIGLRAQRPAVIEGLRPVVVAQEWLADMSEGGFLGIAERHDGRVLDGALTCPGAEEWSEDGDVGMEVGHVRQGTCAYSPVNRYSLESGFQRLSPAGRGLGLGPEQVFVGQVACLPCGGHTTWMCQVCDHGCVRRGSCARRGMSG